MQAPESATNTFIFGLATLDYHLPTENVIPQVCMVVPLVHSPVQHTVSKYFISNLCNPVLYSTSVNFLWSGYRSECRIRAWNTVQSSSSPREQRKRLTRILKLQLTTTPVLVSTWGRTCLPPLKGPAEVNKSADSTRFSLSNSTQTSLIRLY